VLIELKQWTIEV